MAARLRIANSKTSAVVTERLVRVARKATSALTVEGATPGFGPAVIQTVEEVHTASAATLDLLDRWRGSYDAAIIACFADPGLNTARVRYDVPILGLGHASLFTAVGCVGRVAVLTSAGSVAALTR
jgi:allantoin racemase